MGRAGAGYGDRPRPGGDSRARPGYGDRPRPGGDRGRPKVEGRGSQASRPAGSDPTGDGRGWGGVARRGARALREGDGPSASDIWQEVARNGDRRDEPWEPDEVWVQDETPDTPARPGGPTGGGHERSVGRRHNVPGPVVDELNATAGAGRGDKLAARLADATHAYDRERYQEARRILRPLASEVSKAPAVRELYGLVLYRLGQWPQAAAHLEAYRDLTGSCDQHPVLADCYRAMHSYPAAEALWEELRGASPSGELIAEGRIVAAGCRADQGDLAGAISVLERAGRRVNRPAERHLRQWYALADLYERAGDVPRARELFGRVAGTDPDAFDVAQRLRSLR